MIEDTQLSTGAAAKNTARSAAPVETTNAGAGRWTNFTLQIVLILLGLFVSFPVLLAILTSFKVPTDIINYPPTLFPEV
ncbi:MAG: hypothetical protein AAFR56_22245, partial [Chloroflexota bacterium]